MTINLPTLLDVAIGLVFIFFVFSIFVSGIVELINTFFEQRSKLLRKALDKLLGALTQRFFDHQLTAIKEDNFGWFRKPINYLSADSFSTILIDVLTKSNATDVESEGVQDTFKKIKEILADPDPEFKKVKELIRPILAKSDDFKTFKEELEKWYNGYMEQVSGWFKRYARGVVWAVAGLIAIALNVDTIFLTDHLFSDNGLRDRLVAGAIQTTQTGGQSFQKDTAFGKYLRDHVDLNLVDSTKVQGARVMYNVKLNLPDTEKLTVQSAYIRFLQGRIDELKLPIGWHLSAKNSLQLQTGQSLGLALLGWLLTAAALSFGAPFWFDLLLKLVNIRNTARKPPGNPDTSK